MYGLRDVRGYDPPQPTCASAALWQTMSPGRRTGAPSYPRTAELNVKLIGMLGEAYVSPSRKRAGSTAVARVAYRGRDARSSTNSYVPPRVRAALRRRGGGREQRDRGGDEAASIRARARHAEGRAGRRSAAGAPAPSGSSPRTNGSVTIRARSPAGLVVLDDQWMPGWSVRSTAGRPRYSRRRRAARRVVPAGEHEIVWSYRVPGLRAGALLSGLGLLIVLAWGGALLRRRRRVPR